MQKIYVKPENCWINDPNGFIYYKGEYHLFCQCFPYGPRWGRMQDLPTRICLKWCVGWSMS